MDSVVMIETGKSGTQLSFPKWCKALFASDLDKIRVEATGVRTTRGSPIIHEIALSNIHLFSI